MKTSRQNYRLLAQHGLLARIVACGIAAIGLSATFVFSAATQASTPTPRPIVQISDGRIQGVRRGSVDEFLGIPFAAPPVGPLRWQPPRRPKPWATVLQTTRFAPVCAQVTTLGVYAGPQSDDEDCLYLNVFAPRRHPLRPMPVIAYIHGGGNFSGAARDYDASELTPLPASRAS
jgi:para-nitrobenzyl esterase